MSSQLPGYSVQLTLSVEDVMVLFTLIGTSKKAASEAVAAGQQVGGAGSEAAKEYLARLEALERKLKDATSTNT